MFLSDLQPGALIGAGSFGQVIHGLDPVHGNVAVKVFSQLPSETPSEWSARVSEALREARLIASLEHPNIVRVHHFVRTQANDHVLYVMELCAAGSVRGALKAGVPLPSTARRWLYDAAMGIEFLHCNSVLHRDIKPDNLLLGSKGQAKVADFGLATTPLMHGFAGGAGTEFYAAPEVFGKNVSSVASDVWSLGATFVHSLHGDTWTLEHFIEPTGQFKLSGRWLPHIPKSWRLFAGRMMRTNPSDRCASAAAVVDQLSKLPLAQDWRCVIDPAAIRWERMKGSRKNVVLWENWKTRTPKWQAWSEPLGAGRSRTLAISDPGDNFQKSYKSLTAFFASASA